MIKKVVWLPYDFDTAIGINNEGALVFDYELEDIDHLEGGADVFNGQESVVWCNIRDAFGEELASMYRTLRSTGALSYSKVEEMFEEHQGKWPEAIFNEDSWFKYIDPLVKDGSGAYLSMLQGSKAEQRKWWLYNRFRYIDSKYNAGDALSDLIQLRGYAKANITVIPYADIYPSVKYGSYLVQMRGSKGTASTLVCPLDNVNDTEIYIYSASQLASVGDLSGLQVGFADFSMATKLQSLKLGDSNTNYSNSNLQTLYLGNNELLQTIDVRNCVGLGSGDMKTVDLSGCVGLENVYFDGTSVSSVTLPANGMIKVLHLPGTITNLTVMNQPGITDFDCDVSNVTTLRIENTPSIDTKEMVEDLAANSRLRLIGIDWDATDYDDICDIYDVLDTMRGLDEYGNNVPTAQVSGTISTSVIANAQKTWLAARYPYISIDAETIVPMLLYYNYDGSSLLYSEIVQSGGNGTYNGTPTIPDTERQSYTFLGWAYQPNSTSANTGAQNNVTADRSIYAAYSVTNYVFANFYSQDGTTLYSTAKVASGGNASYSGETPTKPATTSYSYNFVGWSTSMNATAAESGVLNGLTADKNVYAAFEAVERVFTVRFINNGVVLQTKTLHYGESTTYTGTTPTYTGSEPGEWVFSGWSQDPTNVTDDMDCIAQFKDMSSKVVKLVDRTITSASSDVLIVGNNAFYSCTNLTSISLPSATSIGNYAFYTCTNLTSVSLPLVTSIDYNAFNGCTGLTSISLPLVTDITSQTFRNCTNLTSISLPSATSIGSQAFQNCSSLTSISLPSATSISTNVFNGCIGLTSLVLGNESRVVTLSNTNAFVNTPIASGTGYIYVPAALVDAYKAANNWSTYASQIKSITEYIPEE